MSPPILAPAARLSKLRAMSPAEMLHRVRYAATLAVERRQHRLNRLAPTDRLQRALQPSASTGDWQQHLLRSRCDHRTRFFASVGSRPEMRALFGREYARELADTRTLASQARCQQFAFFGERFEYRGDIPWQCDPVSGRAWPAVYHADSRVHVGDIGFGDVKYVWELNRQQFLIDLGKSWFLTGNRDDLQALTQLVRSWIAGNPYATGVNWSCALEPAFRVFSWLWAYYLTLDDLDEAFHLEWLCAFFDHARFLERHLELYSSPYNHLIAEGAALYMLGACFPEFADAPRWRTTGRDVLDNRLREQFYGDGGSVEQSLFYHHATIGFYLLAGLLARATGEDLSAPVWSAVERGIDFSMRLSQPDGRTPPIGGADDGKPIRMEHLPFWDFRPYQAIGAVLFDRADFKHVAGRFHEDALWLLGPAGLAAFTAMDARPPHDTATALPASGYYVMRSEWSAQADYLCLDCGEQAAGMRADGIPNSMHGHADCLAAIVSLRGRPVLVDSGLFAYNCGGAWEAHFRETAAHNTAKIDGRDQARHINKMAWSHSYRATAESWRGNGEQAWVIGSHDGFARGPAGVVHRRAVWLRTGSYVLILDEFTGSGTHEVTVNYQFAPGTLGFLGAEGALFERGVEILWAGSERWEPAIACGGNEPDEGWIAPSLGIKVAAPRLRLTSTMKRPRATLLTVLAARVDIEPRVSWWRDETAGEALALVRSGAALDVVAAAGLATATPISTDALLAICRVKRDGSTEELSTGATRLAIDRAALRRCVQGHGAEPWWPAPDQARASASTVTR